MPGFFSPDLVHGPSQRSSGAGEMRELERALDALQATAAHFGLSTQVDARVRVAYQETTRKAAQEILDAVRRGTMTPGQGAAQANLLRNAAMDMMRARTSPTVLAYARSLKQHGKTLAELCEKYAGELFSRPFAQLSEQQQSSVWLKIIQKSGEPNAGINAQARTLRTAGRGLFVLSLALALSDIAAAEDKPRETTRQGTLMAAGAAGGYAVGAAAVATGVCAATAPVCVGALAIVGAMAFAFGADLAFGELWPSPGR
ncbi:hypothetical protein [Piscinibacter gummiphilus]|uniref:Uncharacterized protein n=1 Tax=Piscinibacter gummiphilus TaxID=946333 RepID=A0A1W6L8W6_9BURK|nr:hypothetical protein [Piscinibacter gummiphilus]ARN20672.1 hypothetical protein A4W93_12625 [Piscinibacter gummiphilus]ATU65347.1 hypothetical protein CPZ87_12700 [Piscinibacter gummiphilus]GLS94493.1 hypothetical protein GCM10007918_17850 [Piscinibacter gummiphilus]